MLKRPQIAWLALAGSTLLAAAPFAIAQDRRAPAVPPCPPPPDGYEQALWQRAWTLHHSAIVVDTHVDTTTRVLDQGFDMGLRAKDGHVDLPRAADGGLDAVFYSIYVDSRFYGDEAPLFGEAPASINDDWPRPSMPGTPNGSARRALMMIDGLLRTAERYPDRVSLCTSVDELRAAVAAGRHAALMGIEGGHAIEGELGLLRQFQRLGVRYMTLTHTNHNEFADSCAPVEPRWGGLNRLGVKVVQEMNRLGIIVDVSHVSDATFRDVLRTSIAPVICSHSSLRSLCAHPRNITDDMLRSLAMNGGTVMINFNCGFLDEDYAKRSSARAATRRIQEKAAREKFAAGSKELTEALAGLDARFPAVERPALRQLVAHVLRAIEIAGPDHVGIGSDFDGVPCVPRGMDDATCLPRLTYELLAAGQSEATVRKVLGENLLRVFAAVEQTALSLRGTPPLMNDRRTDHDLLSR
ncbi:MAG TPA: dipeptidase [Planctomycetota bacterium]|nr:dipeptidase [Planctomycetota bacterium]